MTERAYDKIAGGLKDALEWARTHQMTPAEIEAQRQSWVRGMTARCEHGEVDFEQCGECRKALRAARGVPESAWPTIRAYIEIKRRQRGNDGRDD